LPKSEKGFSAHWLASLTPEKRKVAVESMTPEELEEFERSWCCWARDEQLPPQDDWRVWLYLAGRGAGKTRSGAEWVQMQVGAGCKRIALVAPTAAF
jgi:phage terminase large subunit-like protein